MQPLRAVIVANAPILDPRSAAGSTLRLNVLSDVPGVSTAALINNLSETGLLIETAADLEIDRFRSNFPTPA